MFKNTQNLYFDNFAACNNSYIACIYLKIGQYHIVTPPPQLSILGGHNTHIKMHLSCVSWWEWTFSFTNIVSIVAQINYSCDRALFDLNKRFMVYELNITDPPAWYPFVGGGFLKKPLVLNFQPENFDAETENKVKGFYRNKEIEF